VNLDNGSHNWNAFDTYNQFSWRYQQTAYDAGWNVTSTITVADSGEIIFMLPITIEFPVILDLDGNGIDIKPLDQSVTYFDMDGQNGRDHTAWVGGNDGLLAIDLPSDGGAGPDGVIDQADEIIFTRWASGTTSDMAALRQVFDTNRNGNLDTGDERWGEFRIWQDADSDGTSQPREVRTLTELGITSIDLNPQGPVQLLADGSMIQGVSTFTRSDGTTGRAGDVALASETDSAPTNDPGNGEDTFVFGSSFAASVATDLAPEPGPADASASAESIFAQFPTLQLAHQDGLADIVAFNAALAALHHDDFRFL
jgi:hypothetical protein